ncbi:molybdenum cofactor guanylyltransferase MobA [Acidithiobacillus concretivorus]|uniref:Molybdenum cofactor guanylyltransferase n=1 Tax=Acidithiobacillus concretivorus TaxID=3063952 RepID=A0ABS5ZTQ1_9PROT|nr:molybdenum cofactor guanylyltransferase MobA [Acidithiobacillus concretivorus]MBU2739349.1 molybdenum cofactor guanylyltransferase [Acidithiobacillus concretivorus]
MHVEQSVSPPAFFPLPITGLILAGGAGRRMGGVDKGWVLWHKVPLINHAIQILQADSAEILISANRQLEDYRALGYPVISDPCTTFEGPLMGLSAGLAAAGQDWVASIPVDSPLLPHDLLRQMWQAKTDKDLVVVRSDQRWHAVLVLCHRRLLPRLQAYLDQGGRRVQDWFRDLDYATLYLDEAVLRNCNAPGDLS